MPNWKLTLAYDGTAYRGWQVQPGLPTVQGVLADAIHQITGERVLPQGSGRTDSGVHALAQVASCTLDAPIPPANFHRALNRCLPPSIRVLAVEPAPPTFHARHSATRKTYEYRIFPLHPDRICPPTLAPYVWPCPWPLDLGPLKQAGRHILGTHDFTSFAAADPDLSARAAPSVPVTCVRTIYQSQWHVHEDLFLYTVSGSGFLHHMVRNLVGTFVQAGALRLDPESIPALLAARNRNAAGPTAPATGLFLAGVEYADPNGSQLPTDNLQPATAL
jgi:tRNA pseudouridine38-40 synthase